MNKEVGWKPEGFMREKLSTAEATQVLSELANNIENHFTNYGDGIFCHPHEIVGCMYGQLIKLSHAADASIYTGDLSAFRKRCVKTLYAMLVGTVSVDKLKILRKQ